MYTTVIEELPIYTCMRTRTHTHADIYMLIMSSKPVCKSTFISFMYILQGGNSSWKIHARAQRISQKRKQKEVEARG